MSLKLSYFDGRGLAEPTRWVLAHAGVEFEDVRVPLDSLPAVLPPEIKDSKKSELCNKNICEQLLFI